MFNYKETRADREATLKRLFETDTDKSVGNSVGFLIACADFEWTVNRVILALGKDTTKFIRNNRMMDSEGHYVCGLDGYKDLWKEQVEPLHHVHLPVLLDNGWKDVKGVNVKKLPDYDPARSVGNAWEFLNRAFAIRAELIHGHRNRVKSATANFMFNLVLECSRVLCEYAEKNNWSIYGKRIVRLKPRE